MANANYARNVTVSVKITTEKNEFLLTYDTEEQGSKDTYFKKLSTGEISDGIISLTTENQMSNDMGTFNLVMVGTQRWENLLTSNDIVEIRINPSRPAKVDNDLVMVGMISEVRMIGQYGENSAVYQINGNSMSKAITQMSLGTIQELNGLMGDAGWMYGIPGISQNSSGQYTETDGKNSAGTSVGSDNKSITQLSFMGQKASGIIDQLMKWFLFQHSSYQYANNRSIADYFELNLTSRPEEFLTDPTNITSYQGSLLQLIKDSAATPYNEIREDYYTNSEGNAKEIFYLRPTPFEMDDWNALDAYSVSNNEIVERTVSRSDTEAYSIFETPIPSNIIPNTDGSLLANPVYFPSLTSKYGFNLLSKENKYIFRSEYDNSSTSSSSGTSLKDGGAPITSADVSSIQNATLRWTDKKNITADSLNDFMNKYGVPSNSPFRGNGSYFINAGNASGLNPVYILAHAGIESAWGTSNIAQSYHNYFGIYAFDNNPDNAKTLSSNGVESGIINGANWISKNYYQKGHTTLNEMKAAGYATDPNWATSIASVMAGYYAREKFSKSNKKDSNPFAQTSLGDDSLLGNAIKAKKGKSTLPADSVLSQSIGLSNGLSPDSLLGQSVKKEKDKAKQKAEKESSKKKEQDANDNINKQNLKKYSMYLANWYADNSSFTSGEIRVVGRPGYRVGNILIITDNSEVTQSGDSVMWKFYIEGVSHEFSLTSGYTTVLTVTRGLQSDITGLDRFKHYNQAVAFTGGLFGEANLATLYSKSVSLQNDGSGSDSNDSSDNVSSGSGGDDYPDKWRNATPDSMADTWNYYNRECVSFCAWRLSKSGVSPTLFSSLGNASNWGLKRSQYVTKTPHVGDVAWFSPGWGGAGGAGHVAMVTKIDGNNVNLDEYNWENLHNFHQRTVSISSVTGFIHFK